MDGNIFCKISDGELKWNIVDVHGDDGLLHRGCIVGVVPKGLVIDFDSDIQEVVYGKIYRSRQRTFFSENEKRPASEYRGSLVEVLFRSAPDEPCKWYPGTLLFGDNTRDHSFGLIRVYLPDGTDCLAVPGNRFRAASTDARLQLSVIKEGQLVERSSVAAVPNRRDLFTMDQWSQKAVRRGCVVAVESMDHRLHTLHSLNQSLLRRDKRWLVVTDIGTGVLYVKNAKGPDDVQKREKTQTGGFWQRLQACTWFAGFLAAQMFRVTCVLLETYLQIDVYDWNEITLHCLSDSVLSDVFSCLDTLDQVRIRAVCRGWHKTLTSESARYVLRYTYSRKVDGTYRGEYQLAQCLLKSWNEDTQVIAIVGDGESLMSQIGQYIQDIMQEKNRRSVKKLLLYRHPMECAMRESSDNFVEDLRKTLSPLASVCSTLILKDMARITANQLEGDQISNLWKRLDGSCPDLDNKARSTLAAWIRNFTDQERRKVYSQYRAMDCENIAKILTSIQSLDARADVHYRLRKWQPDQLIMLDPAKLTKLTAHALYALMHHDSMQIEISAGDFAIEE